MYILTGTTASESFVVAATSTHEVQMMIKDLDTKFDDLKHKIRKCLDDRKFAVHQVADALTSMPADDSYDDGDHRKIFLQSHVSILFKAASTSELFGTMNFHWNYLNPPLLEHLVQKFDLKEVKVEMEKYKSELRQFRMKTLLTLFCQTQRRKRIKLSPEFQEMVAEFEWPESVTLEVVERFRQEYASHYNLRECAMMIAQICPGSFIITWFIPESIVKKLKANVPRELLKEYFVAKLEISGTCVYRLRRTEEVSGIGCTS